MKWKIETNQDGENNLVLSENGKDYYIYSKNNPVESGQKFYKSTYNGPGLYIIIGIGYFYHLLPFIQNNKIKRLIILEPDSELIAIIDNSNIFKVIKNDKRVSLIIGYNEIQNFVEELKGSYEFLFYDRINLLLYPALERLLPNIYTTLKKRIELSLKDLFNDGLTIARFAKRWLLNFRKNLEELKTSYSLSGLKNSYSGDCIVAAAGPSLDFAIKKLKMGSKKIYFIIAVDAAVRPLVLSGIVPNLIVSIDPQPYIRFHFFDIEDRTKKVPAVLNPLIHNEVLNLFDRKYIYPTRHPLSKIITGMNTLFDEDFNFQSVSTLSVKIAHFLGFSEISLIGFDYAYSGYRSYAKESFFYRYILINSSRFNSFLTTEIEFIIRKLNGSKDKLVSRELNNYKGEMEQYIKKLKEIDRDVKFYNLFSIGSKIDGVDEHNEILSDFNYDFKGEKSNIKVYLNLNLLKESEYSIIKSLALYYRFIKGFDAEMAYKSSGKIYNNIFSVLKNEINNGTG